MRKRKRSAVTPTTIRLGTFLPLSGPMTPRGRPALAGLQAFLKRINDQGGVHGRQLELIALDDEFDPSRTVAVAQRLVEEENVFCLVAPLGTPTNKAVLDYLEKSSLPVVAPLSGSSLLTTPPRRNYFALQVNYVVEGTLLARYAAETLAAQRIAVFYSNDDFGHEGARAFQVELASHQVAPVHVELGWREGLAAGAIIERLRSSNPDTVLLYTYLDQAAVLLREAEEQAFRPQWLGSYVLWDPVLFDLAGETAVENMIVGRPYLDPGGSDPAAALYRRDLARYAPATRPGGYSASGYTAAALLVEGLQRVGPELTRETFIAALESLQNWRGGLVTGISYGRYDRRGTKGLGLARARQGRWVSEKQTLALRDRLLNITAPLALQVNILTRQVMEELGKQRIRQKATDVARQCAIFLQRHPGITLEALQTSEDFRQIAGQSLGETGYTALYGPAPFPAMRIHPNPVLINVDLRTTDRPERFPDWWRQYQHSLANGGQEGGGYYNWEDIDGVVRQKYQYFLPVEGTPYILAATTYLGEFFQPSEEAEQAIRLAVGELTAEIARQILDPIQRIMDGVDRVSAGDLNFQVEAGPAEEAQGLAQAFNRMTQSLREWSDRWAELNRELESRVVERTQGVGSANSAGNSLSFATTLQRGRPDPIFDPTIEAEEIVALIFTGGTTGLPKAAQVSHRMIAWNTLNTVIHDLHHDDTYLNVFPLFHTGGLFVYTLPNVILGGTTILLRQFDAEQVLQLIEQEQVTVFAGVPTMYQLLTQAANWKTADLSSLRFCTSGGAPLPVSLVQQYSAEKGIRFKQGFGMTEFGPGVFALAPEDAIRKAGSIGRPTFYVAAQIVDEDNRPLGPGEVGELVLKGPSQSAGYFNNPEATAAALDDEGWFHTGDMARCDDEWYFTIKDRKKDMFISGGENVYPAEIEAVLYQHSAVQLCAVIGVSDPQWGEVGLACVVLKPEAMATPAELLEHMGQRLAKYKVPKRVEIRPELPISAAGKILKRELYVVDTNSTNN